MTLPRKAIRAMEQPLISQVRNPEVAPRELVEAAVKNPEFFHQNPTALAEQELEGRADDLVTSEDRAALIEERVVQITEGSDADQLRRMGAAALTPKTAQAVINSDPMARVDNMEEDAARAKDLKKQREIKAENLRQENLRAQGVDPEEEDWRLKQVELEKEARLRGEKYEIQPFPGSRVTETTVAGDKDVAGNKEYAPRSSESGKVPEGKRGEAGTKTEPKKDESGTPKVDLSKL